MRGAEPLLIVGRPTTSSAQLGADERDRTCRHGCLLVDDASAPQLPRVAGDVVVFATDDAMYAADLRSWSSARLTPSYGGVYADGGPVVTLGYAPTSENGASVQTLLDTDAVGPLGRTGC